MLLNNKNIILFDLDGTLTDPELGISRCISFALEQMQLASPNKTQLREWIGPPLRKSFSNWFANISADADPDKALALYRQRFSEVGLFENTPYPGIKQLLTMLSEQGRQLFVATAKPTVYAKRILQHFELDHFFTEIHGSELDGRNTNKTDLLSDIIHKHNLPTAECLMIGDRAYDILAAQHHQISSIGVLWGYGSTAELSEAGANCIVESIQDLTKQL